MVDLRVLKNCASSGLVSPNHELDYFSRDELVRCVVSERAINSSLKEFIFRKFGYCVDCRVNCEDSEVEDKVVLTCPSCSKTLFGLDDYQHPCCECVY